MSEQSPWGQPPPPSTPAGGSYPPPPQGPPGGPPGGPGGPGGWSPPSYGGPPSGPPPKKRNTAAIVAIVVGALVVVAAVVVTLLVTTGGDDPEAATDGESTSASPTDPASETTEASPTPDPTPAPTQEPTADPTDDLPADAILGNGYAFELPGIGWQDALAEAQSGEFGGTLDAIIILGASLDLAQSNILVEALTAGGAPDLETLEPQWKRNLSGTDGAVPDDIPDITIDGERAIGVRFTDRLNVNGILIDQVAYLALHDGNQYSIALTLPSENDAVSEADFEKVLDSWVWTD